jgi:hypothetical protein
MMLEHIAKGDPVDVGNFAMMIFNRGETTAAAQPVAVAVPLAGKESLTTGTVWPDGDLIEKIVEYGGERENEGGAYAVFQKSEARRYRAQADEALAEIRAMLTTRPSAPAQDVVRDAERYRFLKTRSHFGNRVPHIEQYPYQQTIDRVEFPHFTIVGIDAAIDAALLAASKRQEGV